MLKLRRPPSLSGDAREALADAIEQLDDLDADRLAVLNQIEAILRAQRCGFRDLARVLRGPYAPPPAVYFFDPRRLRDLTDIVLQGATRLNIKSYDFMHDLRRRTESEMVVDLSDAQYSWLVQLFKRARGS
jgi:hypothetical protein